MLRLNNISIIRDAFKIRASFELLPLSRTALIGPSGGGKSTILDTIAGFIEPQSGQVIIEGRNMSGVNPGQRPVSIVFQDNNLFPHMTSIQNVGLGLNKPRKLTKLDRELIFDALARVGLHEYANRFPGTLSGGQQSRLALARVLICKKPWILLDEPFSALGPAQRQDMLGLVQSLCKETKAGLIMVTHDPLDALAICDSTIVVANNSTFSPVPTKELLTNPPPVLAEYLGHRVQQN